MSRSLSDEEKLLKEFEKMLGSSDSHDDDDDDFGHYFPPHFVNYPTDKDLKYPDKKEKQNNEPPPIPKKSLCEHKNKKKVIVSANLKFWVCEDCKKDLGDV
jgi:hypothetical protein